MWIAFTLMAALFQSMRTAHQNTLSRQTGTLHATLARSLFGLPFVACYLVISTVLFGSIAFQHIYPFFLMASIGAVSQILATFLMLRLFQTHSYATGTLFAKTEALMTALLGWLVFSSQLSWMAWVGVAVGVLGILIMSKPESGLSPALFLRYGNALGLLSGLCFAITSVCVSYASQQLSGHFTVRAGATLLWVLFLQSAILWIVQSFKSRSLTTAFRQMPGLSTRVGLFSALGSIGWFTAFSLIHPALVKTLGQIEVLGTLYYARFRFGEPLQKKEWLGGGCILASVMLVALASYPL